MALHFGSPWLFPPSLHLPPPRYTKNTCDFLFALLRSNNHLESPLSKLSNRIAWARVAVRGDGAVEEESSSTISSDSSSSPFVLDDELINRVSSVKDAREVLDVVAGKCGGNFGVLSGSDCCRIITAALERNNCDLALSIFNAMRCSFDHGEFYVAMDNGVMVQRWRWSRPDVSTYVTLVLGLAASLRVSDALKMIADICRVGVSPGDEVPFGKIVRCPTCMIPVAVAQPQHGIQVVSCSKCRYQYELISGDLVDIKSEEISMDVPAWKRGLRFLQITKQAIPAAVHSLVIRTPSGAARTHRCATETAELPAQEGERVTIALAAPFNVYKELGPFRFSPKAAKYYPGEPMCLTNHTDDRESLLLRVPPINNNPLVSPSVLVPILAVLASGDAASGIINPSLPQLLPAAALASLAVGTTLNTMVLPWLGQLPRRVVDAIAIKQQLLEQYDILQSRIQDLKAAATNEVWMLARMCQLENKIFAVGEPSYRARRNRVRRVSEGLENSLKGRIELIDSYARISSMIEIEVEMDTDVPAAESASNVESIAKQIQQIMELENLEERWRLQAEANDEVERLLSTEPLSAEQGDMV